MQLGQTYEGTSNMTGQLDGIKSLIQTKYSSAVYEWCFAHRFALFMEKSIENFVNQRYHLIYLKSCMYYKWTWNCAACLT